MRFHILIIGLATIATVGGSSPSGVEADHSWSGYHWKRGSGGPVSIPLDDNMGPTWDQLLPTVSEDWTVDAAYADVLDTIVAPGRSDPERCRAVAGRVEVCSGSYGQTEWLGIATIWTEGKHIVQATVKMNDDLFDQVLNSSAAAKRRVLCQEVGHALGLGHGYTSPSCMDDQHVLADPTYVAPSDHDHAALANVFDHVHRRRTPRVNAASFSASESTPPDPLRTLRRGNEAVTMIVDDLGGGRKRISFVHWELP